jgi:hypothetical protein
MTYFLLWVFFCFAAGMFAHFHCNRNGAGWFAIAFLFSPLVAFVLLAILPAAELPANKSKHPGGSKHPGWKALRAGVTVNVVADNENLVGPKSAVAAKAVTTWAEQRTTICITACLFAVLFVIAVIVG